MTDAYCTAPTNRPARAHARSDHSLPARLALVTALALALTLAFASSALAITRATVLQRAQTWVDHPVPYSQSKYHLGYRTDCSGYVSMCWQTGESYCTATMHEITHKVSASSLKPGDALLKAGYHIRLFHNWVDSAHTRYLAYEAGDVTAVARVHSLSSDLSAGYVPVRYNGILDGPAPDNVIWNGSFDAWGGDWSTGDVPSMWTLTGPDTDWNDSLALHRADVAHSSASSVELHNPSSDAGVYTELSQEASVVAGARYALAGWARTGDPSALELSVRYVDGSGATLAETTVSGDQADIDDTAFKALSAETTAPAGTVDAVVAVRLAGSGSWDTESVALVDDVSLTREHVSVSAAASAASIRRKGVVALSGRVAPVAPSGLSASVQVLRPGGKKWLQVVSVPVASDESSASWSASYAFTRKMARGTYRFRVTVPGFGGLAGRTSDAVAVQLK